MRIDVENIRRWADEIRPMTDDEETFLDTLDGQTDAVEILDRLVLQRAFAQSAHNAAKDTAALFTARAQRQVEKIDRITEILGEIMDAMGSEKVTLPIATVTRTKPRAKVEILDESEIPSQLMRVKSSPDLTAIKAQLDAGENVPGAIITQGQPGISVRIK